ncbi:hypothetical protein niasHS_017903 [Heterodera schachtii]|uniref:Uncharacterized protein n=2 Tax=Heterodera TaxID=34509 RepID=A0ABD2HX71_HETSC
MVFLVIALLFCVCTAFNAYGAQNGSITCWSGMGLALEEKGLFGTFKKEKCTPETKSCFSTSFITVHGEVFAHAKGCADESGCWSDGNAILDEWKGIAKRTDCALCFKSNCNKPKTISLDFQLGEIECFSEVKAKALHYRGGNWNESNGAGGGGQSEETDSFTFQLAPKRVRCSAHSVWCLSAKCVPKSPQKLSESSFLLLKGCALPKMTYETMSKLCEKVINGKMEFFRFLPGTKIGNKSEKSNVNTKSISFGFN